MKCNKEKDRANKEGGGLFETREKEGNELRSSKKKSPEEKSLSGQRVRP